MGVSEGSERGQGEGGGEGRSARERPCVESKVRANEERRAKAETRAAFPRIRSGSQRRIRLGGGLDRRRHPRARV